ncbi:hypothetical protein BH10PSE12_BH10PSE12_09070 [soil metagenome]
MTLRPLLSLLALALAGCTSAVSGVYPSLAKRPMESGVASSAPAIAQPPAPPVDDPALNADIARLSAQAQAGSTAFDSAYPEAEGQARAAAKASVSSEAWVAAQVSLSGLESARNGTVSALAGLDILYADRVGAITDGKVQGGAEAIDTVRRATLALVDGQNDRLDRLKALLPQP